MSILDGILGGVVSAGMTGIVGNLIAQHGGLQGLVSQFEQNGMGGVVKSWVGTGANMPITGAQIQQALGNSSILQELAAKSGMSVADLSAKLATILPEAVDKLTLNGTIPAAAA